MVYLGLLFLLFKSPFPNRLLQHDITIKGEPSFYQESNPKIDLDQLQEYEMGRDSIPKLSPGVAANLEKKLR